MTAKINAALALHKEGRLLVGRDRIMLLEKVAELGSISKAAKETGFSYKTTWDSVNAINNLLPTPAFITKPGGRSGGGAEITEEGRRLIAAFHRMEEKLSRISNLIAEEGLNGQEDALLWALGARVSARNVFQSEVTLVRAWPVDVEVTLKIGPDSFIQAIVTNDSVEELQLAPGRRALALVKSSFIHLFPQDQAPKTARNVFSGEILQRADAEVNSQFWIDIGSGKSLSAVTPRVLAEDMNLQTGGRVIATFDPNHVILAVD
jgi:molybdate transport system regulatory protein